jgi:hypothetical protein
MRKKINTIFLLGVLVFLFNSNCKSAPPKEEAPPEPEVVDTCLEGDCKAGPGKMEFKASNGQVASYEGEFVDGNFSGNGTYIFLNGDVYKGQFSESKMQGKGKYTFKEQGDVYEGDFKNDQFDGKGKFTTKSGNIYDGDFKEGKFNGQGKLIQPDGDNYSGSFKDDLPNGKGILKDKSGKTIYEGEFLNGVPTNLSSGS